MSVPDVGMRGKSRPAMISKPLFETFVAVTPRKRFGPRAAPTFNTLIATPWEDAQEYTRLGLAVVPLPPGEKRPAIKWKVYQTVAPTQDEINRWWRERPDDGMAVVLGPVSKVVAIDVDGPDAHTELVRRLGAEPVAPKVLTGSGKPFRYQLLFRHPVGLLTRAKITPWHPQLEFRGRGGLSVLPPSVHPSGRRYRWAEGRSLEEMELPELSPLVLDALRADAESRDDRAEGDREAVTAGPDRLNNFQMRALALITKRLTAVEGVGGDKATYTAACYLVKDYALSVEQALPVLKTWNRTNCRPKWSDGELLYKLQKAAESPGRRGRLLNAAPTPTHPTAIANTPGVPKVDVLAGPAFTTDVPDWVEYPWLAAAPCEPGPRKGRPRIVTGIQQLLLANVVLQKSSVVHLPDVSYAQLVWGGHRAMWPKRWRRKLVERLSKMNWFEVDEHEGGCADDCPAAGTRHRHLRLRLVNETVLNTLRSFATGGTKETGFTYDFAGRRSHHPDLKEAKAKSKQIRERVATGMWCAIYLPAWVFGPRALPPGPCRILKAATRELTRERGRKAQRPDHAELVRGTDNPLLDSNTVYVGFNGNGSRKRPQFHGRGYSLKTRMERAGYPYDPAAPSFRASAKEFFTDLKYLTESLGVVAAVRVPGRDDFLTADEAIDEVEVVAPAKSARKCLIKLFAPANYPDLWRAYFASQLGLGVIPKGEPGEIVPAPAGAAITTSEQLARWLKAVGLSDAELAEELGVDRTAVWDCETLETDGVSLKYSPVFVCGLSPDERLGVLVHEVLHTALAHPHRRGPRDPVQWNVACDLAVNPILTDAGFVLPAGRLMPGEGAYSHLPKGLSAEEYYARLGDPQPNAPPAPDGSSPNEPTPNSAPSDPGGCGSVRDPKPEDANGNERECVQAVAQAERAARGRGDLPAGLARLVHEVVHPPADWRTLLREFLTANARNDFSWVRPNRRFLPQGLYLPGLHSEEMGEVVIAVDTSGSVGERELAVFAREVQGVLDAFDCTVTVLYHDTAVRGEQRWRSTDGPLTLEPVGGGGTSHLCVFERLAACDTPPACLVCLTDLETRFPVHPPDVPVLWAVVGDSATQPPFGQLVRIGT